MLIHQPNCLVVFVLQISPWSKNQTLESLGWIYAGVYLKSRFHLVSAPRCARDFILWMCKSLRRYVPTAGNALNLV